MFHSKEHVVKVEEMKGNRPDPEMLKEVYQKLEAQFEESKTPKDRYEVLLAWDKVRDDFITWSSLANYHFTHNTKDETAKKEREYADEMGPVVRGMDVQLMRQFLANGQDISHEVGTHILKLWESEINGFRDEIQEDAVEESKRSADYTELISSADIAFHDESYNISGLHPFLDDENREVRHEAAKALWGFFEENGGEIDTVYDDLVKIRTRKAKKLGFENYVPLGYLEMARVDYGAKEVENFRKQVREFVVPLCNELREVQKDRLGVDKLMQWDGNLFDKRGNPKPANDVDTVVNAGVEMFDQMHSELGKFFRLMRDSNLLDLKTLKGKAGGGYCTSFNNYRMPLVFANFNGTKHDVEVITHEIGHAFQYFKSARKHVDYQWPTYEACEIHSMSLEFLTWPYMELFFGEDADRFRETHMIDSLLFLPYGCAVDHFQHLVYENPDATPADRHAFWREMERTYLPHLDWGDVAYGAKGGRWQLQSHIFSRPFYYIDYTLALTCAFQYLKWSEKDREGALKSYVDLCARGGEDSFQNLARSAGLVSPFDDGCLEEVVTFCRGWLSM